AAHGEVGAAVGLAHDDGDLRHGGGGVGEEHLGAVADDAAAFLGDAGEEAGDVNEGEQGDVEDVAEADEARGLVGGVDVEGAGLEGGLVGDDAGDDALDAAEADDHVFGEVAMDVEEVAVVHESGDDLVHVDGGLGVGGHELVHAGV